MTITLRRQLNDSEKEEILRRHGRKCFATGHDIPPTENPQFDHIRAFSDSHLTELNNIAPMCEHHNKQKGTLPLEDFRVKLRLDAFFTKGDSLTLKHLLAYLEESGDIDSYGERVQVRELEGEVELLTLSGASRRHALYQCPTTGWRYFYATMPIAWLDSDDGVDQTIGLQPRYLIPDKVFDMFRHFQQHPVLQPSIGRVHEERILLFDGQHKVAALLWNGRREFECKVYFTPELRLLNETNIFAHDKFAQTRFYSSIMVLKLGSEFGADFQAYKNLENGQPKSEAGFMLYLEHDASQSLTKGERNTRFRSYLFNSILQDPSNKAAEFVSKTNRSTDQRPLTIDMLSKSLFSGFLYTEPVEDNMATDMYKRDQEVEHNVALMNMLYELALSSWNPKAGPNDGNQRALTRIFRSKSIMAWSDLLAGAVCGRLNLEDPDDRARPFYRDLSKGEIEQVQKVVQRLVTWSQWRSPSGAEIDRILSDNKEAVKKWFRDHGLTTSYLMGAPE